ncbi:multiple PDZ domain-like protein [Euroglyphus maynei]|uniref:Multiple PDZ domain-like protein n=1 Tax=Euroglyphus maynei TaxID=6958 RepID=A0A1Y3BG23_EURMA|nr:multiple PDZ domain-like protein [Euroglyphus maynei]
MNPNDTVIVIRSLVPGGVAQQDGRLLPGDRLLFVNDQNLENASLDQAVQALKGAPKGVVIVGVAKPLPLPESALHLAEAVAAAAASSSSSSNNDNNGNLITQVSDSR